MYISFLIDPLVTLINKSFESGIFPVMYKRATVIPIFKSGDILDKSNYRPISLLPVFSKGGRAVHARPFDELF